MINLYLAISILLSWVVFGIFVDKYAYKLKHSVEVVAFILFALLSVSMVIMAYVGLSF